MKEQDKFKQWFDDEKKKGLVDIKFDFNNLNGSNSEMVFKEINEIINSPDVEDIKVF